MSNMENRLLGDEIGFKALVTFPFYKLWLLKVKSI